MNPARSQLTNSPVARMIAGALLAVLLTAAAGCDLNVQGTLTGNELNMKVDLSGNGLNVQMDLTDVPLIEVHNNVF